MTISKFTILLVILLTCFLIIPLFCHPIIAFLLYTIYIIVVIHNKHLIQNINRKSIIPLPTKVKEKIIEEEIKKYQQEIPNYLTNPHDPNFIQRSEINVGDSEFFRNQRKLDREMEEAIKKYGPLYFND